MSLLTRLYTFVAGKRIVSTQMNDELNQLVTGHNDHDARIASAEADIVVIEGQVLDLVNEGIPDSSVTYAKLTPAPVSAATASRLVIRDASGRTKMAAPSASDDVAIKKTVDDHAAITSTHGATSAATADRIPIRDGNGRAQFTNPVTGLDAANKDYVDIKVPIVMGTYTGDGAATRDIALPFTPRLVSVLQTGNAAYASPAPLLFASSSKPGNDNSGNLTLQVGANKFVARSTGSTGNVNTNGQVYEYIAYR